MPEDQSKFEGWAIVEAMGHQKYAGFVTTEAYGGAVLFRVDVPGLPARARTLEWSEYINGKSLLPGTIVCDDPVQPFTKLFGAGSIYCITPCTEEVARKATEEGTMRKHSLLSVPSLPPTAVGSTDEEDEF